MLNLLWYVLIGIAAVIIAVIDLLIVVKQTGHCVMDFLDWFNENNPWRTPNVSIVFDIFSMLWGMMLWPLRVLRWYTTNIDAVLDAYDEYVNNLKEE